MGWRVEEWMGAGLGEREMSGANKDDFNKKGENQRQIWQEEVNKGGEVMAGRVGKVDKCDWTAKNVRG